MYHRHIHKQVVTRAMSENEHYKNTILNQKEKKLIRFIPSIKINHEKKDEKIIGDFWHWFFTMRKGWKIIHFQNFNMYTKFMRDVWKRELKFPNLHTINLEFNVLFCHNIHDLKKYPILDKLLCNVQNLNIIRSGLTDALLQLTFDTSCSYIANKIKILELTYHERLAEDLNTVFCFLIIDFC